MARQAGKPKLLTLSFLRAWRPPRCRIQAEAPASVANRPRWSVPLIAMLDSEVAVKSLLIIR